MPDRAEYARKLFILEENIHNSIQNKLELCYNRLDETAQAFSRPQMQGQLAQRQQQLQMLTGQLRAAARAKQQSCALQMNHAASLAASLNPYGVLARGYALVQDERAASAPRMRSGRGRALRSAAQKTASAVPWMPWRNPMRAPKSFEEGMNRLEAILDQMQQPETTLAESVKLYAEAASLTEYCRNTLEKASLQLDEIDAKCAEVQTPEADH